MWVARYAGIAVIGSRNPLGAVANAGITRIPLQLACSAANAGYPGAAASILLDLVACTGDTGGRILMCSVGSRAFRRRYEEPRNFISYSRPGPGGGTCVESDLT